MACTSIFPNFQFLLSYYLLKKLPKLGIHVPNAGDDNQSCLVLTVIFNQIEQLRILQYTIYSSNLIHRNVTIATSIQGCAHSNNSKYALHVNISV